MRLQERHELSKQHTNGWAWGHITLSLLGSSSRPQTVPMNNCPPKASRRVRTTLIDHATLEGEGGPVGHHALHRLGLPLRSAKHGLSRWRRKPCHQCPNPLPQQTSVVVLPVRVGVVSSSHTTKSLTGGVQNTWASGMLASV